MNKADKKKAKKDTQALVKATGLAELADKDLKQVQGRRSSAEQLFIKPRK